MRVVIADDHPMVRRALAEALRATLDVRVEIAEAGTLAQAGTALAAAETDLLLLDLHMPDAAGFAGLLSLRAGFPQVPVVIVSASEDPGLMRRAVEFGASGYVQKSLPVAEIGAALNAVLAGEIWLPEAARETPADDAAASLATSIQDLTPQQLRVLVLVSQGKLNKQIAHEMEISEATVKFHLSQIFRRLGVQSRTQAVIATRHLRLNGTADPNVIASLAGS